MACLGQITPSKFDKICPLAIPNQISTISMHIPSLVKIHWCLLKLSSGNENNGLSRADNSIKIWRNLPISNPKPDLHNINAHTKFGENPLMFTQVIIQKRKYGPVWQITPLKFDEFCPLAIPNQISTISMHIPSLVKIHLCLLKLSCANKKRVDGLTTDRQTDGQTHGRPMWNHNTPPLSCGGV